VTVNCDDELLLWECSLNVGSGGDTVYKSSVRRIITVEVQKLLRSEETPVYILIKMSKTW
jgi:hypothetical protein